MRWMIMALAVALSGCAANGGMLPRAARNTPVGQDFPAGVIAGFVLNETTMDQAEAALGVPLKQSSIQGVASPSSKEVPPGTPYSMTMLRYDYFPYGAGFPAQLHPFKHAALIFFNGLLIADAVNSTIPGESNAPVGEAEVASLRQCETTLQEAIALLGIPAGFTLNMPARRPGPKAIEYLWSSNTGGEIGQQDLHVYFDKSGVMTSYSLYQNTQASGFPGAAALPRQSTGNDSEVPACPGRAR